MITSPQFFETPRHPDFQIFTLWYVNILGRSQRGDLKGVGFGGFSVTER